MKVILFSLLFSFSSMASDWVNCQDSPVDYGRLENTSFQVMKKSNGSCWISVRPNNRYPEYRSFLFVNSGYLMVFNSLGEGSPAVDTGSRGFTLLPVKEKLAYKVTEDTIYVRHPSGSIFQFDPASTKIESITKMRFSEDPEVSRYNGGGLELTPLSGIVLDEGWRVGGQARTEQKMKSTFVDSYGSQCVLANKKVFKLVFDDRGRVDGALFLYNTDADLRQYLAKNCPDLSF